MTTTPKSGTHFFSILLVIAIVHLAASPLATAEKSDQPAFKVGYRVLELPNPNDDEGQPLAVAVWYPTSEQPKTYNYGGPTNGSVALDGAPNIDDGLFPLLVFSHGYGGSGLSSVFLTEALAARGWIVACPDHHDKYSAVRISGERDEDFSRIGLFRHAKEISASGPEDRAKYLYRLNEIKLTLNSMIDSAIFGPLIDRERIAVGGHSFGGYTSLGLSGPIKEYYDPRIKALLLFSTGAGGYLYTEEELRRVHIPSMLLIGEKEKEQRRGEKTIAELSAKIFNNVAPPKYFLTVKGGDHLSFNNRFNDRLVSKLMSGSDEEFEVIRRYSIAFLETYGAQKDGFRNQLNHKDPALAEFKEYLKSE